MQLHRICDQDCIFCAQPTNGNYMSLDDIKNQIDFYIKGGYEKIIFSGGEPSMSPYFFDTIKYAKSKNLELTILTNGHMFQDKLFAKNSIKLGLDSYHISLHSHIKKIHDKIVVKNGSYIRSLKAMNNILSFGGNLTINITINSRNIKYFDKTILFFLKLFPKIDGFIINNLETSQIKSKYYSIIAKLEDIKEVIPKTLQLILDYNKKVRIERVPMCYIRGYEYLSTDIEFTLFDEKKYLHYLDSGTNSGELNKQTCSADYTYGKNCIECDLKKICSGMEGLGLHFDENDLITQKVGKIEYIKLINKIHEYNK